MVTSVDKCDQLSILKQHPTHRESEYRLFFGDIFGRGSPRLCWKGCNVTQAVSGWIHNAVRGLLSTRYRAWHVP